ncbi:Cholesterol 7-alpha-monooxygenase [Rhizophlyctis rosea]|nr:Cholesterol 7-alpha-monooxygenase [Rhizophlyctis rosea]
MFPASTKAFFGRTAPVHIRSDVFLFDEGFIYLFASMPTIFTQKYTAAIKRCITALSEMLDGGLQDANALAVGQDEAAKAEGYDLSTRGAIAFGLLWGLQTNATQAAFWCLAYLITHTDADFRRRLVEEGRECLQISITADGKLSATLNIAKLTEAPLLSSLFDETLRHVSGTLMLREVSVDTTVEDIETGKAYMVRKGDLVALPARHLHRDEDVHNTPNRFNPERFVEKKAGRYELMPFGGGLSLCPGRFFASHEIKAFVAVALQLFDFTPVDALPGLQLDQYGVGVMPPTGPMKVAIKLKEEWLG